MSSRGIPTECTSCAAPLNPHNLTGLCAECKLIARYRRQPGQPADTGDRVTYEQVIATINTVIGCRIIHTTEGHA